MTLFFANPICTVFDSGPCTWSRYTLQLEMKHPKCDEVFQKKVLDNDCTLYFSEKDGHVSFLCHSARDQRGYCGSEFCLKVKRDDGSIIKETVKGPWSSRSEVMAEHFGVDSVQVRYQGSVVGHITLDMAKHLVSVNNLPYEYKAERDGERTFVLFPKG